MTYNEKKSLYENIMKEVAKTVKRHLNENENELDFDDFEQHHQIFDFIKNTYNKLNNIQRKNYSNILLTSSGIPFVNKSIDIEDIDEERLFFISTIFRNLMCGSGTIEEMKKFLKNMTRANN